jgi:hypothetical protein
MLRNVKDLEGYAILANDGEIGHVKDFYFDDEKWVIRYLIVESGSWLSHRSVLITPISIGEPDCAARTLRVSITRAQVKNSPDIDTDKPVSRQHEMDYLGYYGYPLYWGGAGLWGVNAYPRMMSGVVGYGTDYSAHAQAQPERALTEGGVDRREDGDPHLRSCEAVRKYHIQAIDGGVGHVEGMLFDDDTWAIRDLIVDTSSWWFGHQVLIAPQLIEKVSWAEQSVSVKLTRKGVKEAPLYDAAGTLAREPMPMLHGDLDVEGTRAGKGNLEHPENPAAAPPSPGNGGEVTHPSQ